MVTIPMPSYRPLAIKSARKSVNKTKFRLLEQIRDPKSLGNYVLSRIKPENI